MLLSAFALLAACGPGGGRSSATVGSDTPGANAAPIASDDVAEAFSGVAKAIPVLNNDSDPNGDRLTISALVPPVHGDVRVDTAGTPDNSMDDTIVYTARAGFTGDDVFDYTVTDPGGASSTARVSVVVTASPNRPPRAEKDSAATSAGTPVLIAPLANDFDEDGDAMVLASIESPSNGTAYIDDAGTPLDPADDMISYAPDAGYSGPDTILYRVSDGQLDATGVVEVTVGGVAGTRIDGVVMKGPVRSAEVRIHALDDALQAVGAPLAQTVTDESGRFSVPLSPPASPLGVIVSGGVFENEAAASSIHTIALASDQSLESVLAQGENRVSVTPYANAVLIRARHFAEFSGAADALSRSRAAFSAALGFDPLTQLPYDPSVTPGPDSQRAHYALALGGAAEALTRIAVTFGVPVFDYAMISGVIADLADCRLDGRGLGGPVMVTVRGAPRALPTDIALDTQILRFRNNHFARFAGVTVPTIDAAPCAIADTTPPTFLTVPGATTVPAIDATGTPAAAPDVLAFVAAAAATDDDPAGAVVVNDLPDVVPLGTTLVTFTARDPSGNVAMATAPLTVADLTPPTIVPPADVVAVATGPLTLVDLGSATATDNVSAPGAVALSHDAPAAGFAPGLTIVTWTAQDEAGLSATATQRVTIVGSGPQPPVLATPLPDAAATEDVPLLLDLSAYFVDPNADALTFTATGLPPSLSMSASGVLSGTPQDADALIGVFVVTVTASDGISGAASDSFTLTVAGVNDAPVITAQAGPLSTPEDTVVTIALTDLAVTDPDNAWPGDFTLIVFAGANYSLAGNTLTPDADYNGALTVPVRVSDGTDDSNVFNLTVTVTPVNDAPVITAQAGPLSTPEDTAVTITLTDLAVTDPDNVWPGGFTLSVLAGANYSLAGNTLTPDADYNGALTVPVRVSDGTDDSNVFNLTVTVTPVNDAPVITAQAGPLSTPEDTAMAIALTDLTVTDPDNAWPGDFTLSVLTGANYSLAGNTLTPDADYNGALTVPVRVSDGSDDSNVFNLNVTVTPVNDPPDALDDALSAPTDVLHLHDVLVNDSDPEGSPLQLLSVTDPTTQGGSVAIDDNGTPGDPSDDLVQYLSPAGFTGVDSYQYTVGDGTDTAMATVTVTVSETGYVATVTPADLATNVPVTANVVIQFNEAMSAATMTDTHLVLSLFNNGSPALATTVTYNPATFTATIDPASDLAIGTLYYVIVQNTVENSLGEKQGFKVKTSFTTTGDADGDGLSAAEEASLAASAHPCLSDTNPDSDGDGLSDGLEVGAASDPCFNDPGQAVHYVDDDGPSPTWPGAVSAIPAAPASGSPGSPTLVLIASGSYADRINLAGACDDIVYAGSLDPTQPGMTPQLGDEGRPSTRIDMEDTRNSELAGCTNIVLRNIELTRGVGAPSAAGTRGGGLRVSGSTTATLDQVWMTGSTVGDQGGGLGVSNGGTVATVRDSVFADNRVTGGKGGGGIWVGNGATLDIQGSRILRNTADGVGGGGIYLDPGATGSIREVVVAGNRATTNDGGGIEIFGPGTVAVVENSIVSGNSAFDKGGGIDLDTTDAMVAVRNTLIAGNHAGVNGGGLHLYMVSGSVLSNLTVVYNQSAGTGGGVDGSSATANLFDTILFDNRAANRTLASAALPGDSIGDLTQVVADYNLVEHDAEGANDFDLIALARTPDFVAGFRLDQAASLGIDSGSRSASAAGLDDRTTAADGTLDGGNVDRGFHYAGASAGLPDSVALIAPAGNLTPSTPLPQDVVIEPLNASGAVLGRGQNVVFRTVSAPAGFRWAPAADVLPLGPDSALAVDRGDGRYRVSADLSTTGPGTLEFEVFVNGASLGNVSIPIAP